MGGWRGAQDRAVGQYPSPLSFPAQAPEDIVNSSKYGAEPLGGRTVMLDQLQATLGDDVQAAALAEQIESAEFELDQYSIQASFQKRGCGESETRGVDLHKSRAVTIPPFTPIPPPLPGPP